MTKIKKREFKPAETYELLLRQANALNTLCSSLENQVSHWKRTVDQLTRTIMLEGSDSVSAERETNAILTEQVLKLEDEIENLKKDKMS